MRQDVRPGRVGGIPAGANWTVAVILVLIAWLLGGSILPGACPHQPGTAYWAVAVAGAVLFLASLLAHELSHALVARRNGVTVRRAGRRRGGDGLGSAPRHGGSRHVGGVDHRHLVAGGAFDG